MGNFISAGGSFALMLAVSIGGCAKMKDNAHGDPAQLRVDAKRQKASCAGTVANEKLKGLLFDEAIGRHVGDRANLDTLADYSTVRMEAPVVVGRDETLDITRCAGRLILDMPPGAERGLAGERSLQGDIRYSAQASADGNGFVYQLAGADPIVARLAAFKLTSAAFMPPPAIDDRQAPFQAPLTTAAASTQMAPPEPRAPAPRAESKPLENRSPLPPQRQRAPLPEAQIADRGRQERTIASLAEGSGNAVVRAFYGALHDREGASAAAQVIPEKRASGPYSSGAMSRFYGALREPIQLLGVTPSGAGSYRVRYHYSAGRTSCNGIAIVGLTNRGGRELIRSIRALNGC